MNEEDNDGQGSGGADGGIAELASGADVSATDVNVTENDITVSATDVVATSPTSTNRSTTITRARTMMPAPNSNGTPLTLPESSQFAAAHRSPNKSGMKSITQQIQIRDEINAFTNNT